MKLIRKDCFYNRWGTRKSEVEFQGDYTTADIEKIIQDAPYGYWYQFNCIDKDKKLYKGEIHEYWD